MPRGPGVTQTASADELVARLNQRWDALQSLNVTVEIQASVMNSKKGVATDITSIRGHILMRKPEMVRVLGQVPVLGTKAFDMASDGKDFTLVIPPKGTAYKGPSRLIKKSSKGLENMRPGLFFDAMAVRGCGPRRGIYPGGRHRHGRRSRQETPADHSAVHAQRDAAQVGQP